MRRYREHWIDYTDGTMSMPAGLVIVWLNKGCKFAYAEIVLPERDELTKDANFSKL